MRIVNTDLDCPKRKIFDAILFFFFSFEENQVMIWGGFAFMVLARILCIPFGGDPPIIAMRKYKPALASSSA